jgi:hypothetical protein
MHATWLAYVALFDFISITILDKNIYREIPYYTVFPSSS